MLLLVLPMDIAAIIIPTIGSRRNKKTVTPEQATRAWVTMASHVISRSANSVQENGFSPFVIIVDSTKDGFHNRPVIARGLKKLQEQLHARGQTLQILHRPDTGLMEGFMEGARHAAKIPGVRAIGMNFDDFESEAKGYGRFLQPLHRSKNSADFVYGQWNPKSVFSFPRNQVINEAGMSRLASFANPHFKLHPGETFGAAISRLQAGNRTVQTYTGLFAMTPQAFEKLDELVSGPLHHAKKDWRMVGLETLAVLSAQLHNFRTQGVQMPRRFEHFMPKNRAMAERFANTRLGQFAEGSNTIRAFLEATNQHDKLAAFDNAAVQKKKTITTRAPRWKSGLKARFKRVQALRNRTNKK